MSTTTSTTTNTTTTTTTNTTNWSTSDIVRWDSLRKAFERGIIFRGDIGEDIRQERDVVVTAINRAIVAIEQGSFKRGGYRDTDLKLRDGEYESRKVKTKHGNSIKHDFRPGNDHIPRDRSIRARIIPRGLNYLTSRDYSEILEGIRISKDNGKALFSRLSLGNTIYSTEIYSAVLSALFVALFGSQEIRKGKETVIVEGLFGQGTIEETVEDGTTETRYPFFHGRAKLWQVRHDAKSFQEMILRAASRCALREIIVRTSQNASTGRISKREVKHLMRETGIHNENQVRQEIIWRDYLNTITDKPVGMDTTTWEGIIKNALKRAEDNGQGLVIPIIRFMKDGMRTVDEFIREKHPDCSPATVYRKAKIAERYILEAAQREEIIRNTFDKYGSGDYGNSPQHVRQSGNIKPEFVHTVHQFPFTVRFIPLETVLLSK